jgi:methionyl-tRNA formyltransferase
VSRLRDPATVDSVAALRPDLIVVAGFSRILRDDVIRIPSRGCINVHPSLLPRYRGPNPIYWVLANGEKETGVTVHYVDEGIDTGDVIAQRPVRIIGGDDERSLFARCVDESARLLTDVLRRFEDGPVPGAPQDAQVATYFPHPPRGASIL